MNGKELKGKVFIPEGEAVHRVSDLFTLRMDKFIVVFDIDDKEIPGTVLILNKEHIIWAVPQD